MVLEEDAMVLQQPGGDIKLWPLHKLKSPTTYTSLWLMKDKTHVH